MLPVSIGSLWCSVTRCLHIIGKIVLINYFSVADIAILLLFCRTSLEFEFRSTMCFSFQLYIFGFDWIHFGTSSGCTDINFPFVWLDGRLSIACLYVSAHFYYFLFIFHLLQKFCITTTNCNVTHETNPNIISDLNRTLIVVMAARPVVSVYGANGAATGETINMPAVFKEMISFFYHLIKYTGSQIT